MIGAKPPGFVRQYFCVYYALKAQSFYFSMCTRSESIQNAFIAFILTLKIHNLETSFSLCLCRIFFLSLPTLTCIASAENSTYPLF